MWRLVKTRYDAGGLSGGTGKLRSKGRGKSYRISVGLLRLAFFEIKKDAAPRRVDMSKITDKVEGRVSTPRHCSRQPGSAIIPLPVATWNV